jgi:hypothetical protein
MAVFSRQSDISPRSCIYRDRTSKEEVSKEVIILQLALSYRLGAIFFRN